MEKNALLKCIDFFNQLQIIVEDTTSESEKAESQKSVIATYYYNGKTFRTKKLYYRNIIDDSEVKKSEDIIAYFGNDVFWLDLEVHKWPKGKGEAEIENTVIKDIINVNDIEFESFLKLLANNNKQGWLQKITFDGRPQQYGFNLENNNHWHDLVLLVKEIIKSKGNPIDNKHYSSLIFNWHEGERTSLHPNFGNRAIVASLYNNIKSIQMELSDLKIKELLHQKKQIILQGPPGTGKTKKAKEIARLMSNPLEISNDEILKLLTVGNDYNTPSGDRYKFKIIEIVNDVIKVKPNDGKNEYPVSFNELKDSYKNKHWDLPISENNSNGNASYKIGLAKYIFDNIKSDNIKLIQFHPSFTYEDFVRGIKVSNNGNQIEYKTENRILADFASKANLNFINSKKSNDELYKERWIESNWSQFIQVKQIELNEKGKIAISEKVYIFQIDDDCIRYKGDEWASQGRINFIDVKKIINENFGNLNSIKIDETISVHANYRQSYYLPVLKEFSEKFSSQTNGLIEALRYNEKEKNYILIIDEINRANLPSVLGELIYALEYRNEAVDSMYSIEGLGNKITLPPNLYIIGTMNTADRSVGHIDYAIRRRFAFVDIPPSGDVIDRVVKEDNGLRAKCKTLYNEVATLFLKQNLASDFKTEEVQLGHSYFLVNSIEELKMKLEFEIIPILKEYLKDGILLNNETINSKINGLSRIIL